MYKYTARPKKHLDLTKQIGKSIPLDNFCMDEYVASFNPNWCGEKMLIS